MRVTLFLPHLSVSGGLGVHARGLLSALLGTARPDDHLTVLHPAAPHALFPLSGLEQGWRTLTGHPQLTLVPIDWPTGRSLALPLDEAIGEAVAASRPTVFYASYYTGLIAPPCPQAVTFHDAGFIDFPEIFGDTARLRRDTIARMGAKLDCLVCVSEDGRRRVCAGLPFDPARTAYVWHSLSDSPEEIRRSVADTDLDQPLWPGGDRVADWGRYLFSPVGAATGFNRVRKNLPTAVAAFRLANLPSLRLIIASTGVLHEKLMRELLPANELTDGQFVDGAWRSRDDTVRVLPNLDRHPFLVAMGHARGIVYPSRYEGFGLPTIEGMALGVPVVASRATSIPEVMGDAGLLVAPEDEAGFADAYRIIVDDESTRELLIGRGKARLAAFTPTRMGESMWGVFDRLRDRTRD